MARPYAIFGDSHTAAVREWVLKNSRTDLLVGGPIWAANAYFRPFFQVEQEGVFFTEERGKSNYEKWVAATGAPIEAFQRRLILSLGLSGTSFWASRFWQKSSIRAGKKRFITRDAAETMVDKLQQHVIAFYDYCRTKDLLYAALMGPPPQRNAPTFSFVPADEIFELDALFKRPVLNYLSQHKIKLITLPIADPDGFLLDKYKSDDPHHASPEAAKHLIDLLDAS